MKEYYLGSQTGDWECCECGEVAWVDAFMNDTRKRDALEDMKQEQWRNDE